MYSSICYKNNNNQEHVLEVQSTEQDISESQKIIIKEKIKCMACEKTFLRTTIKYKTIENENVTDYLEIKNEDT